MKVIAITLIVLGLVGILWGGFSFTRKEKVVDLGSIEIFRDKKTSVPIPPVAGAIAILAGGAMLFIKSK